MATSEGEPEHTPEMAGPDLPTYYANWITPRPTAYDLSLDFGFSIQRGDPPEVDWRVRVVLSWEEAVLLREFLTDRIDEYEHIVGDIRRWEGPPPPVEGNGHPRDQDNEDDENED